MDLSNFKVLKEDDDSYEIGHPSGRKLNISKNGMSDKAHQMIKKFACGGEVAHYAAGTFDNPVSQADAQAPVADPAQQDPSFLDNLAGYQAPAVGEVPMQAVPVAPNADQAMSNVTSQVASQDPLVQNKISTDSLLGQEQNNVQELQNREKNSAGIANKAFANYDESQEGMKTPQQITDEHNLKDKTLEQAYLDKKIDPDHYWKNQSTGSKIAAGIGLLFSGFGSGLTGGTNLAMDHINKAVESDIEAQKNDQSKAMNLWKMNKEALGDDLRAQAATQNQMWTGVQAKLAQSTAGMQQGDALFKTQQAINDIQQKKLQNNMKLGLLTQGSDGSGGLSKADPLALVPDLVPEAHQKDAIAELGKSKLARENENKVMNLFDTLAKESRPATGRSTTSVANMLPGYKAPARKELELIMDPLTRDNDGKINEITNGHVQGSFPELFDSDSTVATKRKAMQNFIDLKKQAPTAKTFGIDPDKFYSTGRTAQAPETKTVNGVTYARGLNGEAIRVK